MKIIVRNQETSSTLCSFEEGEHFETIQGLTRALMESEHVHFVYCDDEGDSVTVSSHDELAEGLRVAREERRDVLLLEVTPELPGGTGLSRTSSNSSFVLVDDFGVEMVSTPSGATHGDEQAAVVAGGGAAAESSDEDLVAAVASLDLPELVEVVETVGAENSLSAPADDFPPLPPLVDFVDEEVKVADVPEPAENPIKDPEKEGYVPLDSVMSRLPSQLLLPQLEEHLSPVSDADDEFSNEVDVDKFDESEPSAVAPPDYASEVSSNSVMQAVRRSDVIKDAKKEAKRIKHAAKHAAKKAMKAAKHEAKAAAKAARRQAKEARRAEFLHAFQAAAHTQRAAAQPPCAAESKSPPRDEQQQPPPPLSTMELKALYADFLADPRVQEEVPNATLIAYNVLESGQPLMAALNAVFAQCEHMASHALIARVRDDLPRVVHRVAGWVPTLVSLGASTLQLAMPHILNALPRLFDGGRDLDVNLDHLLDIYTANPDARNGPVGEAVHTIARQQGGPAPVLHKNVICDLCGKNPIVGIRFKCVECADFDVCESCEEHMEDEDMQAKLDEKRHAHRVSHALLKMRVPVTRAWAREFRRDFEARGSGLPTVPTPMRAYARGSYNDEDGARCERRRRRRFGGRRHHHRDHPWAHWERTNSMGMPPQGPHPPMGMPPRMNSTPMMAPPGLPPRQPQQQWWRNHHTQGQDIGRSPSPLQPFTDAPLMRKAAAAAAAVPREVGRPRADFVRDVSMPDRSVCRPDTQMVKTWQFINAGSIPWPQDTMLVHVQGDLLHDANLEFPVSACQPGQKCDVSVVIRTPRTPGRFVSYYRLKEPLVMGGKLFGEKVWVDFFVEIVEDEAEAEEPKSKLTSSPCEPIVMGGKLFGEKVWVDFFVEIVEAEEAAEEPKSKLTSSPCMIQEFVPTLADSYSSVTAINAEEESEQALVDQALVEALEKCEKNENENVAEVNENGQANDASVHLSQPEQVVHYQHAAAEDDMPPLKDVAAEEDDMPALKDVAVAEDDMPVLKDVVEEDGMSALMMADSVMSLNSWQSPHRDEVKSDVFEEAQPLASAPPALVEDAVAPPKRKAKKTARDLEDDGVRTLVGMGFTNEQLNRFMLQKYENDVQKVVDWLLAHV